jgi:hypothetical protein
MNEEKNFELTCFFCGKGIDAIKKIEKRTEWSDRDEYEKNVTVAIPCEKDQFVLKFKPTYTVLLNGLIRQAEKETRRIFKAATKECKNALEPFENELGEEIYLEVGRGSGEGNANYVYGVSGWYEYKIEGIDEIKPNFTDFVAHGRCVKPKITLEDFLNSCLVKAKFDKNFSGMSIPCKNIYDKIKHEEIKVVAKKFDFRDYLKEEHEFG